MITLQSSWELEGKASSASDVTYNTSGDHLGSSDCLQNLGQGTLETSVASILSARYNVNILKSIHLPNLWIK